MVMELSSKSLQSPHLADQRLRERASVSSLRKMVALFDYDPRKASPNPDAEVTQRFIILHILVLDWPSRISVFFRYFTSFVGRNVF